MAKLKSALELYCRVQETFWRDPKEKSDTVRAHTHTSPYHTPRTHTREPFYFRRSAQEPRHDTWLHRVTRTRQLSHTYPHLYARST